MKSIKIQLHVKILIGLAAGLIFGLICLTTNLPSFIVIDYVKPFGVIFVNALKMVAMPLILASLIVGVANLSDVSKLSRMGGKTIGIYMATTVLATTLGLVLVNLIQPGKIITENTRAEIMTMFENDASQSTDAAAESAQRAQRRNACPPALS